MNTVGLIGLGWLKFTPLNFVMLFVGVFNNRNVGFCANQVILLMFLFMKGCWKKMVVRKWLIWFVKFMTIWGILLMNDSVWSWRLLGRHKKLSILLKGCSAIRALVRRNPLFKRLPRWKGRMTSMWVCVVTPLRLTWELKNLVSWVWFVREPIITLFFLCGPTKRP